MLFSLLYVVLIGSTSVLATSTPPDPEAFHRFPDVPYDPAYICGELDEILTEHRASHGFSRLPAQPAQPAQPKPVPTHLPDDSGFRGAPLTQSKMMLKGDWLRMPFPYNLDRLELPFVLHQLKSRDLLSFGMIGKQFVWCYRPAMVSEEPLGQEIPYVEKWGYEGRAIPMPADGIPRSSHPLIGYWRNVAEQHKFMRITIERDSTGLVTRLFTRYLREDEIKWTKDELARLKERQGNPETGVRLPH
ncbi:hypothetical protein AX14_010458 [Amanita brunnescens Koide BX004]|nr:hypothetical protein AX14_010458 [Amanita brunnescens Koide BX004]